MSNEIFDLYQTLLDNADDDAPHQKQYQTDDLADFEMFITSKEIVDNNKKINIESDMTVLDTNIEESVHFKRYNSIRVHKYTETEMDEIKESCKLTIVNDYGEFDIYHISDEDRKKNDILSEINLKLGKLKSVYRRVDQYIEAMRIVYEAWNILYENNYIHTKEEFFEMIADQRIVSNRIIMPKLKAINKFNMDIIISYISNTELDPTNLMPIDINGRDDSLYKETDETEEEEMARLLSNDDADKILHYIDHPEDIPEIKIGYIDKKYINGYDKYKNNEKENKYSKHDKRIRKSVATILNKIQSNSYYRNNFGSSYMVTESLFEVKKEKDLRWDYLYFDGSWADKHQVELYDLITNEEMMNINLPRDRYRTYADKSIADFFSILENAGVNTIDLRTKIAAFGASDDLATRKEVKKENALKEASLLDRITKLNENPKFKKIIQKAENALNTYTAEEFK